MARNVSSSSSLCSGAASVYESDLGLDLAPLHKELARHVQSASRTSHLPSRVTSHALHEADEPHGLVLPHSHHDPHDAHGSTLSSPGSAGASASGSDTETEGESESYESLPRVELQNMLRQARRVIRQRERDLELAARVGTALVNRNLNLAERRGGHSHNVSISSSHRPTPHTQYSRKGSHVHTHSHHRHQSSAVSVLPRLPSLHQSSTPPHSSGPSPSKKHAERLRHASTLSVSSVRSVDLHVDDYFDSPGRSRAPELSRQGHHHNISDLSSTFSDCSGVALPSPREDGLVDSSPRLDRRMPSCASLKLDEDEVARAHAREAESQRRLASLSEENMILLERLTQLQADTERNRRDGGKKLHALDRELKELRDELDAVLERNAELELRGMSGQQTQSSPPAARDEHAWRHHSKLLAGLDSLPDLEGVLPLVHSPKGASTVDTSTMPDEPENPSLASSLSAASPSTPSKHQGDTDECDPPKPIVQSVSSELRSAALRKAKAKGKHTPHVSYPVPGETSKADHEEMDSLVKRLLLKIDELERTNIEMTQDGYAIDGRLGQAIEDNERLRDAYRALDADYPADRENGVNRLEEPTTRGERGSGNRYAIAAQRLVNDVLQTDLPRSPLLGGHSSPISEAATEMGFRESPAPTRDPAPWGESLDSFPEPGDHTAEVMDMLREIEELRRDSLPPMPEHWELQDEAQVEMEDDIALVETGDTPSTTGAEDKADAGILTTTEGHLRSLLCTPEDGTWHDEDKVLPLGALRESTVGTTADGYDLISEATGRRPLIWADDEDYGKPITVQQAERYGLIEAQGRGLVGSGWIIFVALRRALGLLPRAERRRVNFDPASSTGKRLGAPKRRLQIQSAAQLEAEKELRQLLRHRRVQFERAVAGMQRKLSSSSASVGTRSSASTVSRWELSPLQQGQHRHRPRRSRESEEILVADLPDYCRPSTSLSHASTEWLVDEATEGLYIKRRKPRSKRPKEKRKQDLAPRPASPNQSLILRAIAEPHLAVANAKAKVDDVSSEVAALLTTWVTFASILVCAGVYMFSRGPRRVLNGAEPIGKGPST